VGIKILLVRYKLLCASAEFWIASNVLNVTRYAPPLSSSWAPERLVRRQADAT